MSTLRPEEEWVRRLIEREVGVPVSQHDDGSSPGMHDLDVIHRDRQRAAVEVAAAVDAESTELWNIVNGHGRWVEPDLVGGWGVHVKPTARRLRPGLPPFLRTLEGVGIREFPGRPVEPGLEAVAQRLGVVTARQSGTEYPGSIYVFLDLPLHQVAGYASTTGDALVEWLEEFLSADARADVREKLARSGGAERHAFVIVSGLSGAPFSVTELLIRDDAPVPTVEPKLPPEVTDVWAASTWDRGAGFRWSLATRRWKRFSKRPPRFSRS
jgi:hypothetical protein